MLLVPNVLFFTKHKAYHIHLSRIDTVLSYTEIVLIHFHTYKAPVSVNTGNWFSWLKLMLYRSKLKFKIY